MRIRLTSSCTGPTNTTQQSAIITNCRGRGAEYFDWRVCLSVCLYVCPLAYLENHMAKLHQRFVHVDCDRGSVHSTVALTYVMYSQFCFHGPNGGVSLSLEVAPTTLATFSFYATTLNLISEQPGIYQAEPAWQVYSLVRSCDPDRDTPVLCIPHSTDNSLQSGEPRPGPSWHGSFSSCRQLQRRLQSAHPAAGAAEPGQCEVVECR